MKIILLFMMITSVSSQTYRGSSENLPKFELGAGIVRGTAPHYPASDEENEVWVPFPAVIYRGEILRADEDGGMRSRFFYDDSFEFNLSIGGALPARTKDNDDRQGMPNLDPMFEFGPGLIYHFVPKLWKKPYKISVNIPVRMAVSSDFSDTRERGIVFNPVFFGFYEITERITIFGAYSWRFASRKYNDTFYEVERRFANSIRPEYKADSGHVLTAYSLALIFDKSQAYSFFAGVSYENYKESANKNSPLFIKEDNLSTGIGFTWWFYSSDEV